MSWGSGANDWLLSNRCVFVCWCCISSLCLPCTATDLPSGECGGGDWLSLCLCTIKRERDRQREESDSKTRCTLSHAVIHLLVHRKQMHTKAHAHAQTFARHTHSHVWLPRRPWGQWDRPSLSAWFVCLHLIIETGLFLQLLLQLFYSLTRERGRERSESKGKQSSDSLFSQWWTVISSPQHCCSLEALSKVQQETEGEEESVLYHKPSHPHVTWMCKFMRSKKWQCIFPISLTVTFRWQLPQ